MLILLSYIQKKTHKIQFWIIAQENMQKYFLFFLYTRIYMYWINLEYDIEWVYKVWVCRKHLRPMYLFLKTS